MHIRADASLTTPSPLPAMNRTFRLLRFKNLTGDFICEFVTRSSFCATGTIAVYSRQCFIYDAILFAVACADHGKTLLQVCKSPCLFVPTFPLKTNGSWVDQIVLCLERMFKGAGFRADSLAMLTTLHQVAQIVLPKYSDMLLQLVVFVEVSDFCNGQCSTTARSPYKWLDLEEITANNNQLWGPEPFLYLINAHQPTRCTELSVNAELKPSLNKWSLLEHIGYTNTDLAALFSDFLQHCFPSKCMNQVMCLDYLSRSQLSLTVNSKVHHPSRLFNAFCITTGTYVTFKDLVFALVALEQRCQHGGIGGELRTRCIFRFYTRLGSDMSICELITIFEDMVANKNSRRRSQSSQQDPQKMAENVFKQLALALEDTISMNKFVNLVGSLAIRGTASLYRSFPSPLSEIRNKRLYDALGSYVAEMKIKQLYTRSQSTRAPKQKRRFCRSCAKSKYSLAVHSFFFDVATYEPSYAKELPSELLSKFRRSLRELSLEIINPTTTVNKLRNVLRTYSATIYGFPNICTDDRLLKWERKEDRFPLADAIFNLCLEAREVYRKCSRVVRCSSPVYVFGDIHGNLLDLMIFDHLLWRMAPVGNVANALFMGDYVDRGEHSLECILYLLCMKILAPNRFHLLRGNHEIRCVQQQFTFQRECQDKFGVTTGNNIWEALNQVFDCMPLCGLVDEQVYCAHGGIPTSTTRIEALSSIPNPLPNPLLNKPGWEILWNDPASRKEYAAAKTVAPTDAANWFYALPPRYMPNTKRGTAYFYGEEATDSFLDQNGLRCILRAHEAQSEGFLFHLEGRVLTVFSTSNYCSSGNQAALVFIDGSKVRVIKVETESDY